MFRYAATTSTDGTRVVGFSDPIAQYPFAVPTGGASSVGGVQLGATDKTFDFNGGTLTVNIYSGSAGSSGGIPASTSAPSASELIQTIKLNFPQVKGLHVPTGVPVWAAAPVTTNTIFPFVGNGTTQNNMASAFFSEGAGTSLGKSWHNWLVYYSPIPTPDKAIGASGVPNPYARSYAPLGNGFDTGGNKVNYEVECVARGIEADPASPAKGDYRIYAGLSSIPSNYFKACDNYDNPSGGPQLYNNVQTLRDQCIDGGSSGGFGFDEGEPFGLYTHFINLVAGGTAARNQVQMQSITSGVLIPQTKLAAYGGANNNGSMTGTQEYRATAHPAVPNGLQGALMSNGNYGDWDNMTGLIEDGAYINKPDEGNSTTVSNTVNAGGNINVYYGTVDISGGYYSYGLNDYQTESGTTFSPNRQIASAVMFGSLPTGIVPTAIDSTGASVKPWQTLLFCPNPAANSTTGATPGASHPGFGTSISGSGDSGPPYSTPPDHLFLDLFTMPVVEPYAISEPLSTAGKINMNYQILPFTYIRRDTAVRAVLKSARILAVPQSASTVIGTAPSYKDGQRCPYEMRYNVNPDETVGTLAGFENRFNPPTGNGDIFRSASEICGIYLVPQQIPALSTSMSYPSGSTPPATYAGTAAWWNNFLLTGDNTRESPYGDIYPRLTTKSNTYTVHVRVQTLKQALPGNSPASAWTQWREGTDLVTGEYRGSSLVERYVDTSDPTLPDFAQTSSPSVEGYYKMRVVSTKKFAP